MSAELLKSISPFRYHWNSASTGGCQIAPLDPEPPVLDGPPVLEGPPVLDGPPPVAPQFRVSEEGARLVIDRAPSPQLIDSEDPAASVSEPVSAAAMP
jgi:hypothetical protein